MSMNRRDLIKGIGVALCAGAVPQFIPSLLGEQIRVADINNPGELDITGYHGHRFHIHSEDREFFGAHSYTWDVTSPQS